MPTPPLFSPIETSRHRRIVLLLDQLMTLTHFTLYLYSHIGVRSKLLH